MNRTKLFCLPYAGGAASIFNQWIPYIDESIDLRPIELAGRGKRITDPFYNSVEEGIDDILTIIKEELSKGPYALFGHSMGSMFCYELAIKIKELRLNQPQHIFFSGRGAPDIPPKTERNYHLLGIDDFKNKIMDMGGTPPEFFDYPELIELFIPLLRNDFSLASTNFLDRKVVPHDCNISVLLGKNEKITADQAHAWRNHTQGICFTYYFNGGHFFINDEAEQICSILNSTLQETILVT